MDTCVSANQLHVPAEDALVTLGGAATWDSVNPTHPHDLYFDDPSLDPEVTQYVDNNLCYQDAAQYNTSNLGPGTGAFSSVQDVACNQNIHATVSDDWESSGSHAPWTPWSRATASTSPSSSAAVTPPEPSAGDTTKAREALLPPQRDPRCLNCKDGRDCYGYPLCQECISETHLQTPPISIAESPFLDRKLWFSICQDLRQEVGELQPELTKRSHSFHSSRGECCKIILELGFEDLAIKRDIGETHTVVCDLHLASETTSQPQLNLSDGTRGPCFAIPSFDTFVLEAMWRSSCLSGEKDEMLSKAQKEIKIPSEEERRRMLAEAEKEKKKLFRAEQELFSKVQIALGYYSLLRNINSMWTAESALYVLKDARIAGAELVYLLAFRLNMLFVEISNICPTLNGEKFVEVNSSSHGGDRIVRIRPAVFLYAVEILYRGLEAIGHPEWDLHHEQAHHSLRSLETNLLQGYVFMLNHLRAYECHLSGWYNKIHRTRSKPGLLGFARAASKGLPKHLVIANHRHLPQDMSHHPLFGFNPFPLLQTEHGRYPIFDIFTQSSTTIASAFLSGSGSPRQRVPEYMITEHNSKVDHQLSKIKYETHDDGDCTNTSAGCIKTETRQGVCIHDHPDPPQFFGSGSSLLALAGLNLDADQENEVPDDLRGVGSVSARNMTDVEYAIPERWPSHLTDAQGQPLPELENWDFRPKSEWLPARKRKQGADDSDGDSVGESTHGSKRRKTYVPYFPDMQILLMERYGGKAELPYLDSVREYLEDSQK